MTTLPSLYKQLNENSIYPGVGEPIKLVRADGTAARSLRRYDLVRMAWPRRILTAVAAVTGIKPRGTRHVAHTRLMGVARLALLALVIIFAYLAFRARSGG